jgi:hypothetical protein
MGKAFDRLLHRLAAFAEALLGLAHLGKARPLREGVLAVGLPGAPEALSLIFQLRAGSLKVRVGNRILLVQLPLPLVSSLEPLGLAPRLCELLPEVEKVLVHLHAELLHAALLLGEPRLGAGESESEVVVGEPQNWISGLERRALLRKNLLDAPALDRIEVDGPLRNRRARNGDKLLKVALRDGRDGKLLTADRKGLSTRLGEGTRTEMTRMRMPCRCRACRWPRLCPRWRLPC